ncbi:MAG TPA: CinA family nicotinamide mononucleotide deamidase-related protein [Polyangiales bacterium]|nr:CinA family nicotinamide mononucleotide deamidase-related protein [Polyangiales bacterium]
MTAVILSIGTELTRGELTNGNARWLSERLTALGFEVMEHATVADDAERIRTTLLRLGSDNAVIVCTGGLGPTSDDITSSSVAEALGVPLVRDAEALAAIEGRFNRQSAEQPSALRERSQNRVMPAINAKQADFPQGSTVLPNGVGTAPGFSVSVGKARAYFLPGVPIEMEHIFETHVVPVIERMVSRSSHQIHVRTFGLPESVVAERLRDIDLGGALYTPGITIGYRVTFPEVEVKVLARGQGADAAEASRVLAERVAQQVRERLADVVYGGKHDSYPQYIGGLLRSAGWKLALAESCTGGWIGKLLTDPPGSSDYLLGSSVVYANTAKVRLLGVPEALLRDHGAVSEEVARAMAEGVLHKSGAEIAVAVTGIAGPTGGSKQKPVGTVCFALALKNGQTRSRTELFPGDRDRVRLRTAYTALRMVADATRAQIDVASQGCVTTPNNRVTNQTS